MMHATRQNGFTASPDTVNQTEIHMKRNALDKFAVIAALSFASMAVTASHASELDCFPACADAVATANKASEQKCDASSDAAKTSARNAMEKIESVNEQIKPVKEIAGYIRSPQGLAVKLVNDHVVKIPAWVGYAIDPVGSIKNRAINEVRTRTKESLKAAVSSESASCKADSESAQAETPAPSAAPAAAPATNPDVTS